MKKRDGWKRKNKNLTIRVNEDDLVVWGILADIYMLANVTSLIRFGISKLYEQHMEEIDRKLKEKYNDEKRDDM